MVGRALSRSLRFFELNMSPMGTLKRAQNVLDRCVRSGGSTGGIITSGIQHTIDSISSDPVSSLQLDKYRIEISKASPRPLRFLFLLNICFQQ